MTMAIDTLLSAAHLRRELGEDLFAALVSSDNTAAVRNLANKLLEATFPIEMTVGGRTYETIGFLRGDEISVSGSTMLERAKEFNARCGKDDKKHLLAHQGEIPSAFRGKATFVFTDDFLSDNPELICFVYWRDDCWIDSWYCFRSRRFDRCRALRRK